MLCWITTHRYIFQLVFKRFHKCSHALKANMECPGDHASARRNFPKIMTNESSCTCVLPRKQSNFWRLQCQNVGPSKSVQNDGFGGKLMSLKGPDTPSWWIIPPTHVFEILEVLAFPFSKLQSNVWKRDTRKASHLESEGLDRCCTLFSRKANPPHFFCFTNIRLRNLEKRWPFPAELSTYKASGRVAWLSHASYPPPCRRSDNAWTQNRASSNVYSWTGREK